MSGDYFFTFRRNFELYATGGWIAGAVAGAFHATQSSFPQAPFWIMAAFCLLMAFHRGALAWRVHNGTRGLKGKPLSFISPERLRAMLAFRDKGKTHIFLGYGFEWDQRHTQKTSEILSRDKDGLLPESTSIGWSWIHGLERSEQRIWQPIVDTKGHTLVVGTTGSGKTRTFDLLVTQAVLRDEAVFIIDPKGDKDLCETARRACAIAGKPERFLYFHPGFPEESHALDPLANFNRPTELASRIAELIPAETGANPFKAFGQMALNNVVQGLILAGEQPNIVNIRRYLESGSDGLVIRAVASWAEAHLPQWRTKAEPYLARSDDRKAKATGMMKFYYQELQPIAPSSDLEGLLSMFQHDRDHFTRMIASLFPVLNMLTSGSLGPLLSPPKNDTETTPSNTASIIRFGSVAYLGLDSLTDSMVGSAIGSILLSDLAAVAGDRYNYGVGTRPVTIFIDEAAEVINDRFIQLLNKGRGAGIKMVVATQTFADFAARTGSAEKARQVLGNVNNVIALRVLDAETQKYFSDGLPMTKVKGLIRDQSTSAGADDPLVYSASAGERMVEQPTELFPPALLGNLPNLEFVAKLSGGRVWKGRVPILGGARPGSLV